MEADESDVVSNVLNFCKSSRGSLPTTRSALQGLELMQAFMKIEAARDRQKVIELAKQFSIGNADTRHNASRLGDAERALVDQ
jgi:hypothetical protein